MLLLHEERNLTGHVKNTGCNVLGVNVLEPVYADYHDTGLLADN